MAHSKCRNVNNLDSLLADIYEKYVRIRRDDFALHYKVFDSIWNCLHRKMEEVDTYYGRYSSKVQTMGSHYDRLRIKTPNEFDIFNVIRLPPEAEKNVVIKPEQASFVFLEINENCRRELEKSPNWEANKQFLKWLDNNGRIQRSKFFDWFKGVVDKALRAIPVFVVDGVKYIVERSETGPAVTLIITNSTKQFQMDVDFVPALKFPSHRWPPGRNYRAMPDGSQDYDWMVVAKPDKYREEENIKHLQWRIALPEQERDLVGDSYNFRQAMRLLKKLRDTQGMTKLVSYFLKQLVYMKIDQGYDHSFWRQSPAVLFKVMVEWLHDAVKIGRIPYYWNSKNNLLQRVGHRTLKVYENTLYNLIKVLEDPKNYMKVANYLLNSEELRNYN